MKILSVRLKEILKSMQISQAELARRIKVSPDAVNTYCSGKRNPPLEVLVLICKEVGETSDYLLGLSD